MASLTGQKIKDSYSGLLKTSDNGALGASAKQLTDGLGTGSPIYASTSSIGIGMTPITAKFEVLGESRVYTGASLSYWGVDAGNSVAYFGTNTSGYGLSLQTSGTERMRIDSSGNVGIGGTPSINYPLTLRSRSGDYTKILDWGTDGGSSWGQMSIDVASPYGTILNSGEWQFKTNGTERMRITSGGDVQITGGGSLSINRNDTEASEKISVYTAGGSMFGMIIRGDAAAQNFIRFQYAGNTIGSITGNSTTTTYAISSDYRLKEDWQPMTNSLDRISSLNPVNFAWKSNGKRVDGFLAHELQEVIPEAVTGTKDAMRDEEYEVSPAVYEEVLHPAVDEVLDEEGNILTPAQEEWTEKVLVSEAVMGTRSVPDYQGIDQSKIVPLLVAAIQELKAEVDALKGA